MFFYVLWVELQRIQIFCFGTDPCTSLTLLMGRTSVCPLITHYHTLLEDGLLTPFSS
jgi:hypothetical protein